MNSHFHLQTLRHFYEEIKGSENKAPDLVSCLEIRYSLSQLAIFFEESKDNSETQSQATISSLKEFLTLRWNRIQGTNLSYVHSLQQPITLFCIQAATAIAAENKVSEYDVLMPGLNFNTIDVSTNESTYKTLENKNSQLHEYIISDDNHRLINVSAALEYAIPDKKLKHNQLLNDKVEPLTESEVDRIINHSQLANKYYHAIQNLNKITHEGHTIGSAIQRLIKKLRQGGIDQSKQIATPRDLQSEHKQNFNIHEFNSGADANEGIFEFHQFLQVLTPEEKQNLFECKAPGLIDNFGKCWQRLARENIYKEYYLSPMSTQHLEEKVIEFKCEEAGLNYRVIGLDNHEKKGFIKWENLPNDFPRKDALILANTEKSLLAILKVTAAAGHTLKEKGTFEKAASTYCVEITANNLESILLKNEELFNKHPANMPTHVEIQKISLNENKNESNVIQNYQENAYKIAECEVENHMTHFQKQIKKLDYIVSSNYGDSGTERLWKQILIQAKDRKDLDVLYKPFTTKPNFILNSLDLKTAIPFMPESSSYFPSLDLFNSIESLINFVKLISPEKRLNNLILIKQASLHAVIRSNKQLISIIELLNPADVLTFLHYLEKNHLLFLINDINELFNVLSVIPKHYVGHFAKGHLHTVNDIAGLKRLLDVCSDNHENQSVILNKIDPIEWERFIGDIECLNTILESSLDRLLCINQINNSHFLEIIDNAPNDLFLKFINLVFNFKINNEMKSEIKLLPAHRKPSSTIENKRNSIHNSSHENIEALLNAQIRTINNVDINCNTELKVLPENKLESKVINQNIAPKHKYYLFEPEKWFILLKKFSQDKIKFEYANQIIKNFGFDTLIINTHYLIKICQLFNISFTKQFIEQYSKEIQKLLNSSSLDDFNTIVDNIQTYNRLDIIKAVGRTYLQKVLTNIDQLCKFLKNYYKTSTLEILQNIDISHLGNMIYRSEHPRQSFLNIIVSISEDHLAQFINMILTAKLDTNEQKQSSTCLKTQVINYFFCNISSFLDLLKRFGPSNEYAFINLLDNLVYQSDNNPRVIEYKALNLENSSPIHHSTFLRIILRSSKNTLDDYHQLIHILMHQYTTSKLLKMNKPFRMSSFELLSISEIIKALHTDDYDDYPVLQMIHLHYLLLIHIKQQQQNEFKNSTCSIFAQPNGKGIHAALLLSNVLNREANFCDLAKYKSELAKGDLSRIYKRLQKLTFFKQIIREDQLSYAEQLELRNNIPTLKPAIVNGLFR